MLERREGAWKSSGVERKSWDVQHEDLTLPAEENSQGMVVGGKPPEGPGKSKQKRAFPLSFR